MKKILILGGYGFLGQNLNKVFKDSKYEIHLESRRTGCDILNYNQLLEAVKKIKPNIIINTAAHVGGVGYVSRIPAEICSDNTLMFINIFKVIEEVDKNILLINPLANCSYPGDTLDVLEESSWWDGIVHESVEAYGNTKKIGFILSECYRKQYGIKTINLLVPNAYGPFDYTDEEKTHAMNGIILRMLKSIKNKDKEFNIWGSGTPIREWVYMEDVARLIKLIIDENITNLPNPINIGQEKGFSIKDSVNKVQEIMNINFILTYDLTKKEGAPKKIMSSKLFKQYFPNFVFTTVEDGIKNTINYYENTI
jgi:GDP-L-fucose synthase